MVPGRDRTRDPWICSQTLICSQTRYRLRYAARSLLALTLCILVTPKCVLWQTVKTQMKCCIMQHFIRVYTVCYDKNNLQQKKYIFYLGIIVPDLSIYIQWTIPSLLNQTKKKNPLGYKGLKKKLRNVLTLILPTFFVLKMLSAYYVCCIFQMHSILLLSQKQTLINPDQIAQ